MYSATIHEELMRQRQADILRALKEPRVQRNEGGIQVVARVRGVAALAARLRLRHGAVRPVAQA
jgi:hypothetical protein